MEETFEGEVKRLWMTESRDSLHKLGRLQDDLTVWAKRIKSKRSSLKRKLTNKLEGLMVEDWDDDNLSELIDLKIKLNWEIEKDELYWEQRARAN